MNPRLRWFDLFFILLFFYLFIMQLWAIWPFTIDDMFITLRYAKHWSAGDGLVWNVNTQPVEGYSNFSFVVLALFSLILRADPVIVLKIAGAVGLFLTCCFVFKISRNWFHWREALLPCLGLLLYKGQIIWSVSGLETTVYQALICGSVYFIFRGLGYNPYPLSRAQVQSSFLSIAGLLLAIACLTRPEAPALVVLFSLLICWDKEGNNSKAHGQGVAIFVLSVSMIFVPYFLWRWHYFGFVFPNPVYCKSFVHSGFLTDIGFLSFGWPWLLLSIFACLKTRDKRTYFLVLPCFLYLMMLANSDPVVAFANRLFLPAIALLFPLSLLGLKLIIMKYTEKQDSFFYLTFYIVSFLMAFFFIPGMSWQGYRFFSDNPVAGEQLRKEVVNWLDNNVPSHGTVVLSDSGLIPYYSALNYIDSYCLNNVTMGHDTSPNRYKQFCHSILKEQPQVIILTSLIEKNEVTYTPTDACLRPLLENHRQYKLIKDFTFQSQQLTYRYELFTNF